MAILKKEHLYYSQELSQEEAMDPTKASIGPSVFSRRPPTNEDQFFFEQERNRARTDEPKSKVLESDDTHPQQQKAPRTAWGRVSQKLNLWFNGDDWRP